jgi:hypothetical protein
VSTPTRYLVSPRQKTHKVAGLKVVTILFTLLGKTTCLPAISVMMRPDFARHCFSAKQQNTTQMTRYTKTLNTTLIKTLQKNYFLRKKLPDGNIYHPAIHFRIWL